MDESQVIWQKLRTKQNHLDLLDERNRSIRQQREEQFEDLQQKRDQLLHMMEGKYQMIQHTLGQVDVDTTEERARLNRIASDFSQAVSIGFIRNQRALEQSIEKEEIEYRRERRKLEEDIDTLHRRKMKFDQEKKKG
ncbi:hypothetical protein HMPREF2628_05470 [Streptococcus sp. HMSC063B03]|jgi:hypothetical protein|uniref:Uncharacterized protein n=1 Tax=Streptococcus mitis TaxID=28037 RepID=A0A150NX22_STRMT|nr:hypothetical protein [Streptococcus sp. HMSC063B03]KYF37988.1 hypothetical protein SMIM3I_00864 [Streptococcus mitis]OHP88624.1 hypothetical protein HMPREF2628_05470 [Streptococcus sp. HMSC063B03]